MSERVSTTNKKTTILRRLHHWAKKALVHLLLITGSLMFSIPFLWMLSTSLKAPGDVLIQPPRWIPNPIMWSNYSQAWTVVPFGQFLKNTCIITGFSVIGHVVSSSLVAYGFSRLQFPTRDFLFFLLLGTMILPMQVTMIPLYLIFFELGWLNTFKPLIVPAFFGSAFYIFLLRQFFMSLPKELDDAAVIDGCSTFGIYWRIILPLAKPALATVAVFSFIYNWNDFLRPLIYLTSMEKMTVAVGLRLFQGYHSTEIHLMMAASTLALIPIIVTFFFAQKYFIQGIALTGIKG